MASNEGFLTGEQREMLKIASQNAEILSSSPKSSPKSPSPKAPSPISSSPKSPPSFHSEHHIRVATGGKAPTVGFAVRHVRRTHSGKVIRVKKGEILILKILTPFGCVSLSLHLILLSLNIIMIHLSPMILFCYVMFLSQGPWRTHKISFL